MSEPQHPQGEGTQTNVGRSGAGESAAPHMASVSAHAPLDSIAAVGARLAQLREAKGLSVDDVSARLKVSVKKMRALEAGDISHLPGTTFALGVIRSYAKMLGTDPEPFTQALRRVKGDSEPDLSMPASTGAGLPRGRMSVSLGGTPKHRSWWWGVAAGIIVIIALAMWRQGGDSSVWLARLKASAGGMAANPGGPASGAVAPGTAVTAAGTVGEQAGAASDAAADGSASGAAATEASGTPIARLETTEVPPAASQPEIVQAAPPVAAASAPASASAAGKAQPASKASEPAAQAAAEGLASGASTIAVKVTQDSWFSIRDKNGKEVFSGLVHAGDTKDVSGTPPFKITAGNRAGLESVTLDGQPVDAAKFGPNKGNVVRFTLP
jgi:cytoskeleton protein RodZ